MLLLKRWKPIISNYFSSQISIWIRIHGLPLHYWTLNTIHTIRRELGPILDQDINQKKIRIDINDLENLEMRLPIQLPSGEVIHEDLEYNKL
ncbi:hypothetical protein YC2023_098108 [Brassica napus]